MTALDKYTRLEGPGVWRAAADEQRRDVNVLLGDASLVITDTRSGMALSHWSLPAVRRLNRGTKPAVFSPCPEDDSETLELDDTILIEALDTIRAALTPRRPLRRVRLGLSALAVLTTLAGLYWLPGLLVDRTAAIVPPAMRAQIGRSALDSFLTSSGGERVCADPQARQVLATLRNRVLGTGWRVSVIAGVEGLQTAQLPGNLMILGADLIDRLDSAEALAGWMLAETLSNSADDPLRDALHFAGVRATLALMTTGTLPEEALSGYAGQLFAQPAGLPQAQALGPLLDGLGLSPTAYVLSLPDQAQGLAQGLADRQGVATRRDMRLLSDGQWLTLQEVCST